MRKLPVLFVLVATAVGSLLAAPTELAAPVKDLSLPSFDASGQMTRRLFIKSGAVSLKSITVREGKVEFFPAAGADRKTASVLDFENAHYSKSTELITGDGRVVLSTDDGTIEGREFEGNLETGQLTMNSPIKFLSPEFELTGDRGEVKVDPHAAKNARPIRSAMLTGHVTLRGAAAARRGFERAETTSARYDATQNKLFLKMPITTWRNGEKTMIEMHQEYWEIDLIETPASPAPLHDVLQR